MITAAVAGCFVLSGLTAPAAIASVPVTSNVTATRAGDLKASPSPQVYLDTDGEQFGLPGVRIDDANANIPDSTFQGQFFEAKVPTWLQVVVLNRSDLSPIYSRNYSCPQVVGQRRYDAGEKAAAPCIAAVQQDFINNKLDDGNLVIATNFGQFGNDQAPYGVIKALKPIGVQPVWWWGADAELTPGTFSAVGVPGAKPGEAHQVAGNSGNPDQAAVRTLLARNNSGMYDVMPNDRVEFVTDARGSDSDNHVMRINGKRISHPVNGGGYHVAWFDRGVGSPDLINVEDDFFATADPKKGRAEIVRMTQVIRDIAGTDRLALVASVGQPLPKNLTYDTSLAIDDLVDALQWLGATRNGAYGPLDTKTAKGQSYTLVGHGDGPGVESTHLTKGPALGASPTCKAAKKKAKKFKRGSAKAKQAAKRAKRICSATASLQGEARGRAVPRALGEGVNNAGVAGVLSRDNLWRYEPTITLDGDSDPDLPAVSVVYSKPGAWPGDDDIAMSAAIADIGQAANLGNDPRAQYWTQTYREAYWNNRLDDVRAAAYKPTPEYSAAVFTKAQNELIQEIKWVKETYDYYDALARPYEKAGLQTWAKMTAVADSINNSIDVPKSRKVTADVVTITRAAAELVGEFPGIGKAVALGMATFDLAAEIAEVAGGEVEDEFSVAVSELGEKTADRLDEVTTTVGTDFPRIVVSDYQKLKRVGQCAGTSQACADRDEWMVTPEGLKETGEQFKKSMAVMFYQSLMPAKYKVFELDASPRKQANTVSCAVDIKQIFDGFKPWKDASPRVSTPVRLYASHADDGLYNVLALAQTKNEMQLFNELSYPSASSLEPLFGLGKDQLKVDPEAFIERSWDSYVGAGKYACAWDKNAASGKPDSYSKPKPSPGLGHGLTRDVKARIYNDTGRRMWVAGYYDRDGKHDWKIVEPGAYSDGYSSDPYPVNTVRIGVLFHDPARGTDDQDEVLFENPTTSNPRVWHLLTDPWSHNFTFEVKTAQAQTGWKDRSYQSNGYPYNLFMKLDDPTYHYFWFTAAYSLRPNTPLSPPGQPWGNE